MGLWSTTRCPSTRLYTKVLSKSTGFSRLRSLPRARCVSACRALQGRRRSRIITRTETTSHLSSAGVRDTTAEQGCGDSVSLVAEWNRTSTKSEALVGQKVCTQWTPQPCHFRIAPWRLSVRCWDFCNEFDPWPSFALPEKMCLSPIPHCPGVTRAWSRLPPKFVQATAVTLVLEKMPVPVVEKVCAHVSLYGPYFGKRARQSKRCGV